ncbi:MAG TPA: ATP-dependent DNA ligase [Aquihabitans sp.]|jgi:ATP-dependent DNA ligase|nr:ATP-dependent DNA ligase [Aquihabitans sp.]
MDLPVMPPLLPMLAKAAPELPDAAEGDYWFEPKWDGFRCLVFRDGDEVELGSRNDRPLTRYFPELLDPLRASLPQRCVVDGEIVVAGPDGLDFDALQQRIHPAESRVQLLAAETPASFVAFDLVALGDEALLAVPLAERRRRLEEVLGGVVPPVHLTPGTYDRALAHDWFSRFEGAGLDGVMAKAADGAYQPNKRTQLKVKHLRTADCVVAGYREHKNGDGPGSLMLGLYDDEGRLHNLGVASSFSVARRAELRGELAPYVTDDLASHPWGGWADAAAHASHATGRLPGAPSRWNGKKDLSFTPLRPELVVEVAYERVDSGRFRHSARFQRWRPDREPESCTFAQLEVVPPVELSLALDGDRRAGS